MEILNRVINVIAAIINQSPDRIRGTSRLREDFGFTDTGVVALAEPLNLEFTPEGLQLTGAQLAGSRAVNDVALVIILKVPKAPAGTPTIRSVATVVPPSRRAKAQPKSRGPKSLAKRQRKRRSP
jgi:hypothetical protein